jgi:hypothetical protein
LDSETFLALGSGGKPARAYQDEVAKGSTGSRKSRSATLVTAGGVVSGRFAEFVSPFQAGQGFNTINLVYGRNAEPLEFLNLTTPPTPPEPPLHPTPPYPQRLQLRPNRR